MPRLIQVGDRLKGRYLIERELGSGSFGLVYLGRDMQLHGKQIVVKVLRDLGPDREWSRRKFREECQALARINHPGVVQVLDNGETDRGEPYLVLQLVQGCLLRSIIANKAIDLDRVAHIVEQVGQALTAVHNQGVCHRDLKPENIILSDLGGGKEMPIIIDFGIAVVSEDGQVKPQPTRVAGSYAYMAPEQLSGSPSAASDIFALGVIAYEMVTGTRPFKLTASESPVQLWYQHKQGVKTKPSAIRHELPRTAEAEILKALAFEPKQRHRWACEFGDALAITLRDHSEPASRPSSALNQHARSKLRRALEFLIPSCAITLVVRWYLNTSPLTRDQPLSFSESSVVFGVSLVVIAVVRSVLRLVKARRQMLGRRDGNL